MKVNFLLLLFFFNLGIFISDLGKTPHFCFGNRGRNSAPKISLGKSLNGVLVKNTLLLKGLSFNNKYTKSIFSPIWFSLSPKATQIEQSSYSGIILNKALFGPFIPLSMDK